MVGVRELGRKMKWGCEIFLKDGKCERGMGDFSRKNGNCELGKMESVMREVNRKGRDGEKMRNEIKGWV